MALEAPPDGSLCRGDGITVIVLSVDDEERVWYREVLLNKQRRAHRACSPVGVFLRHFKRLTARQEGRSR